MKGKQMPRKQGKSAVKRVGSAIARTARKLTTKLNPRRKTASTAAPKTAKPKAAPETARATKRTADVPLDLLADAYTPKQTSLKTAFRSDGADRQNDQEMLFGAGDRWQDEDHFTNKSGDARIGTHGRSYEPGEQLASETENRR
jgi:hypothetical protein